MSSPLTNSAPSLVSMNDARHSWFLGSVAILLAIWRPLWVLTSLSLRHDQYSYIILIRLISGFFICWQRKGIFAKPASTNYVSHCASTARRLWLWS